MTPKYVVTVEQHGTQTIEVFDTFAGMLGQWYNYGLCDCKVLEIRCQCGAQLSERQRAALDRELRKGLDHWSHKI